MPRAALSPPATVVPLRRRRRLAPPLLAGDCALFLDIDGTLVELAPTPAA